MILEGEKTEEYREMKTYWHIRLQNKSYDFIKFTNGYGRYCPYVTIELKEVLSGLGIVEWGAPEQESVYILKLGKILLSGNLE